MALLFFPCIRKECAAYFLPRGCWFMLDMPICCIFRGKVTVTTAKLQLRPSRTFMLNQRHFHVVRCGIRCSTLCPGTAHKKHSQLISNSSFDTSRLARAELQTPNPRIFQKPNPKRPSSPSRPIAITCSHVHLNSLHFASLWLQKSSTASNPHQAQTAVSRLNEFGGSVTVRAYGLCR